jgi:hypothetical protein
MNRSTRSLMGRMVALGLVWSVAGPGFAQNAPADKPAPTIKPTAPIPPHPPRFLGPVAFNFTFKADTPLDELLPTPPRGTAPAPQLVDNLDQVREIAFQEPLANAPDALRATAHTLAKINHLNRKETDGFLKVLLGRRPDLAGLPLKMGDDCRMCEDRSYYFKQALASINRAKGLPQQSAFGTSTFTVTSTAPAPAVAPFGETVNLVQGPMPPAAKPQAVPETPVKIVKTSSAKAEVLQQALQVLALTEVPRIIDADKFWDDYHKICYQDDKAYGKLGRPLQEHALLARIAALMQVMAPESPAMRLGLVKFLAGISHAEATRALARLAIFSDEDDVRRPALDALKVRRDQDYTEVLVRGLRYPLPAVAKRAADAIVKLERADLAPELFKLLEEPDPRAPTVAVVNKHKVPVQRELVRINHHRNCVLCHAPAERERVPAMVVTAEVPRPDQPLRSPGEGYLSANPDVLVRLDVTYLRQDFSLLRPVKDAHPWPEMQRFDYLVRTRVLSREEEAAFPRPAPDTLNPYQRASLAALRELTGRDAAPTAEAWRKVLGL